MEILFYPLLIVVILLPSIFGVKVFRAIGRRLNAGHPHLKQYANAFALAAALWGPLQAFWFYGIIKPRSYYVDDRSQPPPTSPPARGYVFHYPQKYVEVPHYHYGVGYKFNLGNPVAKFIYDQLGPLRVTYVMSAVDVLIIGCVLLSVIYFIRRTAPKMPAS